MAGPDLTLRCPDCGEGLSRDRGGGGGGGGTIPGFACPGCGGISTTLDALGGRAGPEVVREVRAQTGAADAVVAAGCPSCRQPMRRVTLAGRGASPRLCVCPTCRVVWLGAAEIAQLSSLQGRPEAPAAGSTPPLPPSAQAAIQRLHVQLAIERAREDRDAREGANLVALALDLLFFALS